MSYHPVTRLQLADWAAAHGPCQAAASLLTPEELFTNYITTKEN